MEALAINGGPKAKPTPYHQPNKYDDEERKLLLEVLSVWPNLKVSEHHITFANRASGRSKFGVGEIVAFLRLCLRLWWYRIRHRH